MNSDAPGSNADVLGAPLTLAKGVVIKNRILNQNGFYLVFALEQRHQFYADMDLACQTKGSGTLFVRNFNTVCSDRQKATFANRYAGGGDFCGKIRPHH